MKRLYSREKSGRPPRIRWALEEVGEPYEFVQMTMEEAREGEEHRKRHPMGRVPVMEYDDGSTLFEVAALILQVADEHPEAKLNGELGSIERGLVYQWLMFAMTEVAPGTVALRKKPEGEALEQAKEKMEEVLAPLNQALDGHDFLVSDRLTAADIATVGILNAPAIRPHIDPDSNVAAYVTRLMDRPAFKRAYD